MRAPPETVQVTGRLCVWRVFGIPWTFTDRPPDVPGWTTAADAGPESGDTMTLTIGDLPDEVVESITFGRVISAMSLDAMFGGGHAGLSLDEREQKAAEVMAEMEGDELKRLKGPVQTWLTLEVSRPITVQTRPGHHHLWLATAAEEWLPELKRFAEQASDYLVVAAARLLPSLGERLRPSKLLYAQRRAYLLVPGKPGVTHPVLTSPPAHLLLAGTGWDEVPRGDIDGVLKSLASRSPAGAELLQTASRWLWAALAEDDMLRRFQFAFFGLEVLTNKLAKKMRTDVATTISTELGFPVEQLFWPTPEDPDTPRRNVVFNFAVMTIGLARRGAGEDIERFRALVKVRHKLSHGNWNEADDLVLPGSQAIELLQRYLSLAADADQAGAL